MNRTLMQTIHVPGTLAANILPVFKAYSDMTLVHVSASASNAQDGTVMIGTVADTDAFMAAKAVGDSDAPAEYDRDDFIGAQFPRIEKGDLVKITIDFDGSSGTAAANLTVVLTYVEG